MHALDCPIVGTFDDAICSACEEECVEVDGPVLLGSRDGSVCTVLAGGRVGKIHCSRWSFFWSWRLANVRFREIKDWTNPRLKWCFCMTSDRLGWMVVE